MPLAFFSLVIISIKRMWKVDYIMNAWIVTKSDSRIFIGSC